MPTPIRYAPIGFRSAGALLAAATVLPFLGAKQIDQPVTRVSTPAEAIRLAGPAGYAFSLPRFDGIVSSNPHGSGLLHVSGALPVPASAVRGQVGAREASGAGAVSASGAESRSPRVTRTAFSARTVPGGDGADTLPAAPGEQGEALVPSALSGRRTMIMGGGPDEGGGARETMLGESLAAQRPGGGKEPRPESPGSVVVVSVQGMVITIQWSDRSSNESGFVIEHQTRVGSTWTGGGTYTLSAGRETADITVSPGSHRFRVAATGAGGTSRWTSWSSPVDVNGISEPVPLVPAQPANLVVQPGSGSTAVVIRWDDTSANETGFEIERSPGFSGGTRSVGANVAQTADDVSPGTYQYRVRAFNANGASMYTPWAQLVVTSAPPAAPTSLTARDALNERDITVQWVDASDNEESFVIERQKQLAGLWGDDTVLTAPADATTLVDAAGLGTFRYRVAALNTVGQSSFTAWASATATASGGWTEFTPSSDTRIVYVSSSEGDDTNDGLAPERAKRTMAAGKALIRNGYPDWLLFKRGDVWENETFGEWNRSGRSESEPVVMGAYGEATARPLFKTGQWNAWETKYGPNETTELSYLAMVGLEFWAHTYNGTTSTTGIRWLMPGTDFLIEDCLFRGYQNNLSIQGKTNSAGSGLRNFRMRRCVVTDAYSVSAGHSQGMFLSNTENSLIEECVFDHNGWSEDVAGANATIFNRNLYLSRANTGVVTRRNIVARSSSEGLQQRSGGMCEENLFLQNSAGVLFGQFQSAWPSGASSGTLRNNVVLDARDVDTNPRGHGIWVQRIDGVEISGNIVSHQRSGTGNVYGIYADYEYLNLAIRDNIIYRWVRPGGGGVGIGLGGTPLGPVHVENNSIVQTDGGLLVVESVSSSEFGYAGNRYHSDASQASWYRRMSNLRSFAQWVNDVQESGATNQRPAWVDPDRTIETYMASLGREPSLQVFVREARQQSRRNWRPEFTAAAVNEYIRAGFATE